MQLTEEIFWLPSPCHKTIYFLDMRPCSLMTLSMLRRVRNCRRYYYYLLKIFYSPQMVETAENKKKLN